MLCVLRCLLLVVAVLRASLSTIHPLSVRPCHCCVCCHISIYTHSLSAYSNSAGPPPSCLRSPTYAVEYLVEIRPSPCANNTVPPTRDAHTHRCSYSIHQTKQHSPRSLVRSTTAFVRDSCASLSRMLETHTPRQHVPTTHHPWANTTAAFLHRRP